MQFDIIGFSNHIENNRMVTTRHTLAKNVTISEETVDSDKLLIQRLIQLGHLPNNRKLSLYEIDGDERVVLFIQHNKMPMLDLVRKDCFEVDDFLKVV